MGTKNTAAAPAPKSKTWFVVAAAFVTMLSCACLVPLLSLAGYALWPRTPQAEQLVAVEQDGNAPDASLPIDQPAKVNDPASGTPKALSAHPWWRVPVTEAGIDNIVASMRRLPLEKKALLLYSDGGFATDDQTPIAGPELFMQCWNYGATGTDIGFTPGIVNPLRLASRALAIKVLNEGLDQALALDEKYRKTGKTTFDFELPNYAPKMGPTPGATIMDPQGAKGNAKK